MNRREAHAWDAVTRVGRRGGGRGFRDGDNNNTLFRRKTRVVCMGAELQHRGQGGSNTRGSASTNNLRFVVSFRGGYTHDWFRRTRATHILCFRYTQLRTRLACFARFLRPNMEHKFTRSDSRVKGRGLLLLAPSTSHIAGNLSQQTPSNHNQRRAQSSPIIGLRRAGGSRRRFRQH